MINLERKPLHSSIYMIRNKVLNKCYIGRSVHPEKRLKDHFSILRNGNGWEELQKDFDEYGEDSFETNILETFHLNECDPVEREDYYILKYKGIEEGYNKKMSSLHGSKTVSAIVNGYIHKRVAEIAMESNMSASGWIGDLIRKEIERADKNESKS